MAGEDDARAIGIGPGEGTTVDNPLGGPLTFKVRGADTAGALTVFESIAAPGEGPPLHVHPEQDETLYILEGAFRFKLDDRLSPAPTGSFVYIPRGEPHTWQNVGLRPGRLLVAFTPAATGLERFFELVASRGLSGPEAFRELGPDSGMVAVGPPLAEAGPLEDPGGEDGAVALVRTVMAAATRRDIATIEGLMGDDFRFDSTFAASEGRVFAGPSAIRDYFDAVDEAFDEVRIEMVDTLGVAGERVAIRARVTGKGRGSGIVVDHIYGQVWTVRDGKVMHVASFMESDEALRSIGADG